MYVCISMYTYVYIIIIIIIKSLFMAQHEREVNAKKPLKSPPRVIL